MTQQALSNGIRTWTRRGLKGAGVLLIPALALTAYSAVPTQGVILNDNPPAVPCVSGPCTYDPSNYSSARFVGAVANTAAELGDTIVQGDFNQDGLPDLAMGGPRYAGSRGLVQVVYGSAGGPTGTVDLGGSAVVTFFGKGTSSLGLALGAGDITDDGIVDLVIGAPDLSKVYIVPGSRTAWTSQTGSNGIENHPGLLTLTPSLTGSSFGSSLAVGDIGNAVGNAATSDGKVDLIVGAPSANSSKGAVYLIYGPITTSSSTIDAASNVFTFNGGNTGDRAGDTVAIFPSVTEAISANGIPDIGIGAPAANMTGGKVYLIEGRARDYFVQGYGSASGGLDVGLFRKRILVGDLTETATIKGGLGLAIAGIGDVNHDDFYDIAVGAPYAPSPTNTSEAGRVYVFFGSSSVLDSGTGPANLSTVVTPYLYGETTSDQLGSTIVGLNDLDGDAFDDFLVAARRLDIGTSSNDLGGVYAVSGRSTSSWGLTGKKVDGSRFQNPRPGDAMASAGPFNSYKGLAIAGGLDLDGDGHSDFFVGAPGSDVSGSGGQGRVYFISYGDFLDRDSDGQDRASGDCDDENNASRYRADGSGEVCDGFDNDCDGLTDEADPSLVGTAYYTDADLDGYGRNTTPVQACGPRSGLSLNNLDCDDASASTNPAAAEVCDGKDNDCDTAVDDADSNVTGRSTWYKDGDGDGYGTTTQSTTSCNKPSGYVSISTDCNDNNAAVNPGATESCDGIDNDCDNKIDANDNPVTGTSSYYPDGDGDGYGNSSASATAGCPNTPPTGQVTNRTDCNDSSAAIHPGAPEGSVNNSALSCLEGNGIDNDCDGIIDEGTCSSDDDNDGQTEAGGDCDNANPTTYSGGTEQCNGVDDDCDASIDEDFDQDNDGQLDATRCTGSGLSTATDCDDQDPSVYAGAPVQCDGKDTDCNGILPDSGYSSEADADNDATRVCDADCDDTDNTIYPSNTEICDEKDNDCNELIDDDAIDFETFYADTDGDQYGDSASTIEACDVPSSYSINDTDCDDSDNTIYPGAAPICDGDDHDCNGEVDLELPEFDGDSDGYLNAQLCTEIIDGEPLDCDDSNTDVHPLAEEVSGDGIDNNCDGVLSEGAVFEDAPQAVRAAPLPPPVRLVQA